MGQSTCSQCFNRFQFETSMTPPVPNTTNINEENSNWENGISKSPIASVVEDITAVKGSYVLIKTASVCLTEDKMINNDNAAKSYNSIESDSRFTTQTNLKIIISLQKFRRSIIENNYFKYTQKAKEVQKKNHQQFTFFTTSFINKMEQTRPFKLTNWKEFYTDSEDTSHFQKTNPNNLQKIRIIDEDSVYIGEVDSNHIKNGYGCMITSTGNLYKGNWVNNNLFGWCRIIKTNILYEGKLIIN